MSRRGTLVVVAGLGLLAFLLTRKAKEAHAAPAGEARPAPVGGKGDVDMDGWVSESDLTLVQEFILQIKIPTAEEFRRADFNGDGSVNVLDLTAIVRYIKGLD